MMWLATFMLLIGICSLVASIVQFRTPTHVNVISHIPPHLDAQTRHVWEEQNRHLADDQTRHAIQEKYNHLMRAINGAFFFVFLLFVMHVVLLLKQQIASPRAVLVPHYRRPHLIVAAALVLPVMILWPLTVSFGFSLSPLPVFAASSLLFTLILWCSYLNSLPFAVLFLAVWFGAFSSWGQNALRDWFTSPAILAPLLLIAVACFFLFRLVERLLALREEMPEYHRTTQIYGWQAFSSPQFSYGESFRINYNNRVVRFTQSPSRRVLARLAESRPTSLFRQLQRWQLGQPATPPLFFAGLVLMILLVFLLISHLIPGNTNRVDIQIAFVPLFFFPLLILLSCGMQVWRTLGVDSLRPVPRKNYLRQRAAAVALSIAQVWFAMALTFFLAAAVLQPEFLATANYWLILAATAIVQIPIFAIFFWFLRYRSMVLSVAIYMVFCVGLPFLFIGSSNTLSKFLALPHFLLLAVLLLLASALILRDAYRRWLTTDLA